MKIKWSGIGITEGHGKIGGSIAMTGRYGAFAKKLVIPTNTRTPFTNKPRASFANFAGSWKNLPALVQQQWIDAAASWPYTDVFGDSITLSGLSLYIALNTNVYKVGGSPLYTPPAPPAMPTPSLGNAPILQTSFPYIWFDFGSIVDFPNSDNWVYCLELTPPLSNGIRNFNKYFSQIYFLKPAPLYILSPDDVVFPLGLIRQVRQFSQSAFFFNRTDDSGGGYRYYVGDNAGIFLAGITIDCYVDFSIIGQLFTWSLSLTPGQCGGLYPVGVRWSDKFGAPPSSNFQIAWRLFLIDKTTGAATPFITGSQQV